MSDKVQKAVEAAKQKSSKPGVSFTLPDGAIAELAYDPAEHKTKFIVWKGAGWEDHRELQVNGRRYVPYSPENNLIKNDVVLLPSKADDYGTEADLVKEVQEYIHRYVDVSLVFELTASYYVLFSWIYDSFNELPYLRARGDYGSGKTRFLLTVGSICYKPIFASGASTVSPLFRILDAFRGTLIIDESDFRWSDERAELTKILNNGNARGFPVLRSESTPTKEYNPRAYAVYGPKILASRGVFDDKALESRFFTEDMGLQKLRSDVPINLPAEQKEEARALRNKLLLFRFRNRRKATIDPALADPSVEPRLNQIFVPLLSIIENTAAREELRSLVRGYNQEIVTERGMAIEGQLTVIIKDMLDNGDSRLSIKDITDAFVNRHGEEYDRKVTSKYIGYIIRHRLHLKTHKSHGVYIIPIGELAKLPRLYEKLGMHQAD